MSYSAIVYRVFIASPGDTAKERDLAEKVINQWNTINSKNRKMVLLPLRWENNAAPDMSMNGQDIIDKELLEESDILIGIFKARIGSPTTNSISGTVGEITKHVEAGKLAMLYFFNGSISMNHDSEQLNSVRQLKADFQSKGLTADYKTSGNLVDKLRHQLAIHMNSDRFTKNEFHSGAEFSESIKQNVLKVERPSLKVVGKLDLDFPQPRHNAFDLSDEAKDLLIATYLDKARQIMHLHNKTQATLQTNNKNFFFGGLRIKANYTAALEDLETEGLIKASGIKRQLFVLTKKGYEYAEVLGANLL